MADWFATATTIEPARHQPMRTYRFHGLDQLRATSLAADLRGQGLSTAVLPPDRGSVADWVVEAIGDDQNEEWLEVFAHFYGGTYEGEDLSGA